MPAPAEHRRYCILTENMMEKGGGWVRQKTETLSERVAVKIRQYIIENEMKAGDRLPNELQMAEYCEVGRGTVRDAVKLLRFEGLVEVVQGSGTYLLRQKQKPIMYRWIRSISMKWVQWIPLWIFFLLQSVWMIWMWRK